MTELKITQREAANYGVRLSETQIAQLAAYASLLQDASKRMNLVGDAAIDVIERRHFLESIALGAAMRERELMRPDSRVLDLGSGAGFPGAVLAIVWPGLSVTLLEATAKKAAFLESLVAVLPLPHATVGSGRAETLAHEPTLRGAFDLVVARAVAPLPALVELALPFLRLGGRLVTPKGSRADSDVAAAKAALATLGGRAMVMPFAVPGPPQKLIVVAKTGETPDIYPRRDGVPAKSPL